MVKYFFFQSIIFGFFMMFNSFLFANDIVPRPYEKAKIGQWVLFREEGIEGITIKSVIMDVGFANEELVYIILRNETDNLNNNEKSIPEYILLWGDDIFQYVPQIYWPQEIQEREFAKISGQINKKPVTKWIIALQYKDMSEPHHALYPEIMGGLVIELNDLPYNTNISDVAKTGSFEIVDFGDDYNLDEYPIPSIDGVEMDDVFLVDPKIGQWVEVTTYGSAIKSKQRNILEKRRMSIIDIKNTNNGKVIVIEETVMIEKNSILNKKMKKYNPEHVLKRNAGYKNFFRFSGYHIDNFYGDINGKTFKGYRIFDNSIPNNEIILSKDIPISGFVSEKDMMTEISTTDFSRLKNGKMNGK